MLLEFDLVQGTSQNILIDVNRERIHFLPKEMVNLRAVLNEYIDYPLTDCIEITGAQDAPSWVELIETDYAKAQTTNIFRLAEEVLAEFLLFHVKSIDDYTSLLEVISRYKAKGTSLISQITIAVDFDPALCSEDTIKLIIQVNGKKRDELDVAKSADKAELEELALAAPNAQKFMDGKTPKRVIVVPGRLVNIVV